MKKSFGILFIMVALVAGINSKAKAQATPEELMEAFFTIFNEDVNQAVDYLFATNQMIDPSQPGIKSIKERLELSRKLLGNYYGYELIDIYTAGDSYRKYVYSLKYERQPVKFIVVLYRPEKKWKVQNINFQDDIELDFKRIEE
jgi:hypothetical protein